ncbi:hypothetical protein [Halalkalicoccus salilacus]|uniref:hypothetical protein n=1 Tax=Halalkalicoccus sp. GCM10025704 TaxID=3252662 RepID=UPI00360967BF
MGVLRAASELELVETTFDESRFEERMVHVVCSLVRGGHWTPLRVLVVKGSCGTVKVVGSSATLGFAAVGTPTRVEPNR